ncbi:MAG TPA: hypothetical protein GYA10_01195 [Alphaproteobacteria bacterium]|nr:hypothetical protein [Alphaproteobacteria bacterium]
MKTAAIFGRSRKIENVEQFGVGHLANFVIGEVNAIVAHEPAQQVVPTGARIIFVPIDPVADEQRRFFRTVEDFR